MSVKLSPSRKRFFSMLWHRHTCCSPGTIYTCFGAAVVNGAHLYRNCPRLCRWPVIPCLRTRHAHTFRYDMPKIRPISHPPPSLSRPFPFSPPPLRTMPTLALHIYLYPSSNSGLNLSSNNNNEAGECHVSALPVWVPL